MQSQLAILSRSGHVGEKDQSENAAAEWSRGYGQGSIRSFEATWPLRRLDLDLTFTLNFDLSGASREVFLDTTDE